MNFTKQIEALKNSIARNEKLIELYGTVLPFFDGIKVTGFDVSLYQYAHNGAVDIDIKPSENCSRDLQPLAHKLTQKFGLEFEKSRMYDEQSLQYQARFTRDGVEYRFNLTSVVPKSCHLEETEVTMTDEEYEKEKAKLISEIKRTKIVRKIVCS